MTPYKTNKLHDGIYSLYEQTGAFSYLLIGSDSALLFDTTFGMFDLHAAVRSLTDLPVHAVLSHGHYDHTNGACQFDTAYIHPADEILCRKHTGRTCRRRALDEHARILPDTYNREAYIHAGTGNLVPVQPGHHFDLGGITAEVVALEGHTAGSIGLHIPHCRILLVSDALGPHVWMFLKESLPIPQYLAMLQRIQSLPFDIFYIGHSDTPRPKSDIALYEQTARNIDPRRVVPYTRLPELSGLLHEETHNNQTIGIVYKP